jgi:cell division topological specificity factor
MMFSLFKSRRSAPVARDRLKVLLAHERAFIGKTDLVAVLREEILAVIARHVTVDSDTVRVRAERSDTVSMLTVDIEIPTEATKAAA